MYFILNQETINVTVSLGTTLLDFIRYNKQLMGTKIGCREGDCGACTVLIGSLENGEVQYKSATSCITPLGNIIGKHIVTVEGINQAQLTPVQSAMVAQNGTQCGFCTVGFVMSLTGTALQNKPQSATSLIAAIDGNICRCTGYKSIEKAAFQLLENSENGGDSVLQSAIKKGFVPAYFAEIPTRLTQLSVETTVISDGIFVGGGTDLYVQRHEEMPELSVIHLVQNSELNQISLHQHIFRLGGAVTVSQMENHPDVQAAFPNLGTYIKLISSTPIRNIATLAGNLVNASPIGDLSAFFLALDANLILKKQNSTTEKIIALKDFYQGYKQINKLTDEYIAAITFTKPKGDFNFEKVCKRTHLDIATVNSAIQIETKDNVIQSVHLSFGGVFAFPFYAQNTINFLQQKPLSKQLLIEANKILQSEIKPISDVRGSEAYKRLLARQLFYAHFITLFEVNPL